MSVIDLNALNPDLGITSQFETDGMSVGTVTHWVDSFNSQTLTLSSGTLTATTGVFPNGLVHLPFTGTQLLGNTSFFDSSYDQSFSIHCMFQLPDITSDSHWLFATNNAQLAIARNNSGHQIPDIFIANGTGGTNATRHQCNNMDYRWYMTDKGDDSQSVPFSAPLDCILSITYDGANLVIYVNGAQVLTIPQTGNLGLPAPIYVGGIASAAATGNVGAMVTANSAHTADQVRFIASYLNKYLWMKRILNFDGNSIVFGLKATQDGSGNYLDGFVQLINRALGNTDTISPTSSLIVVNNGVASQTTTQMIQDSRQEFAVRNVAASCSKTVYIPFEIRNDLYNAVTQAQAYANYVTCCQLAMAAGFQVVVMPAVDSGFTQSSPPLTASAYRILKNAINADLLANWQTFGTAIATTLFNDTHIVADGAADNLTYFNSDTVHPNDAGHQRICDDLMQDFGIEWGFSPRYVISVDLTRPGGLAISVA